MLFELLDKLSTRINKMDITAEAPRFAVQLRKMRPTLVPALKAEGITPAKIDEALLTLSAGEIKVIKGIPAIVDEMTGVLRQGSGEPAFRCVLAGSLAYLVQPQDLLPDDLPGGYGFIDDALLLHEACALSWELSGDSARAEEKRKIFEFIFLAVPDEKAEQFRASITGLALTLNLMRSMGPQLAEMTTQMLIANPLQPVAPQAGMGTPSAFGSQFTNYQGGGMRYSWRDGNTMGVNFPGGGGVATDGRDIFIL